MKYINIPKLKKFSPTCFETVTRSLRSNQKTKARQNNLHRRDCTQSTHWKRRRGATRELAQRLLLLLLGWRRTRSHQLASERAAHSHSPPTTAAQSPHTCLNPLCAQPVLRKSAETLPLELALDTKLCKRRHAWELFCQGFVVLKMSLFSSWKFHSYFILHSLLLFIIPIIPNPLLYVKAVAD